MQLTHFPERQVSNDMLSSHMISNVTVARYVIFFHMFLPTLAHVVGMDLSPSFQWRGQLQRRPILLIPPVPPDSIQAVIHAWQRSFLVIYVVSFISINDGEIIPSN